MCRLGHDSRNFHKASHVSEEGHKKSNGDLLFYEDLLGFPRTNGYQACCTQHIVVEITSPMIEHSHDIHEENNVPPRVRDSISPA